MSQELFKSILILVLVVSVAAIVYSIISAVRTIKKNKAKEEANRKMFMSKIDSETAKYPSPKTSQRLINTDAFDPANEHKPLDYDVMEDDIDDLDTNGKSLKDFFGN